MTGSRARLQDTCSHFTNLGKLFTCVYYGISERASLLCSGPWTRKLL